MTVTEPTPQPAPRALMSRRSLIRFATAAGAGALFGPALAACAGPAGTTVSSSSVATATSGGTATGGGPATGALRIALNRNLISLDNKLNQFDAAVTVQRAVRQALTKIGDKLTPELVLAESFETTSPPSGPSSFGTTSSTRTGRRSWSRTSRRR